MTTKFNVEVARVNEDLRTADKERVRLLFKKREQLQADPRQYDEGEGLRDNDSPAAKWLDELTGNSEALLRVYIDHIVTSDWVYKQLTEQIPHVLNSLEGERKMFDELKEWAEI